MIIDYIVHYVMIIFHSLTVHEHVVEDLHGDAVRAVRVLEPEREMLTHNLLRLPVLQTTLLTF